MNHLIKGVQKFTNSVFPKKREFFEAVAARKQKPRALLTTCSDSPAGPNVITPMERGDLFSLRSAGKTAPS